MYANTTNGHRPHTSKNAATKVLQMLNGFGGTNIGVIIQDTITTTEEWFGLSYTDANNLCTSSETSTLNGTTRQYLGSAFLQYTTQQGVGNFCRSPSCWGTSIASNMQRMGDTNLYHVVKTTTDMTVRKGGVVPSGSTLTLTLE